MSPTTEAAGMASLVIMESRAITGSQAITARPTTVATVMRAIPAVTTATQRPVIIRPTVTPRPTTATTGRPSPRPTIITIAADPALY